jgi:uncharacterized protein YggT (Ycf19 family)
LLFGKRVILIIRKNKRDTTRRDYLFKACRERIMNIIEYFNSRVKMLNIYDIKLIQGTTILLTLIIVRLIPQLMNVDIRIYIVLLVLFLIRPLYVFFIRKA